MDRKRERTTARQGVKRTLACAVLALGAAGFAGAQLPGGVQAPQPTVPEIFTLMGQYVRVAYNNEGFASLAYRIAQLSQGEEWMMLQVGLTVRSPTKNYRLKREHLSIKTPDGTVIPLADQKDYSAANLRALNMRLKVQHDSLDYFPVDVTRGCPIQFFAELGSPGPRLAFDEVELSSERGCVGRLFFHVPGGIKVGQHWLLIKFEKGELQVPFRILTEEEAKAFSKSWQDIKKAHEAGYKEKK